VRQTRLYEVENARSVPYIGNSDVWQWVPGVIEGVHGEGVKIAIIDTGLDYAHANFGGPGTVAAYDAANATDTLPADPTLFGPNSITKITGGTDLVGDDYDARSGDPVLLTPGPDPNPLDCNGHGSLVGGQCSVRAAPLWPVVVNGPNDLSGPTG
jgi:minor extracellular serine protease Vpr